MKDKDPFIGRQIDRIRVPIEIGRFVVAIARHAITGRHLEHMEDTPPPAHYRPPAVTELEFSEPVTVDRIGYTPDSGSDRRDLHQRLVEDWGYPPEQVNRFTRQPDKTEQLEERLTNPYG